MILRLLAGLIAAAFASPAIASDFPVTIDNCGTPEIFARAPTHAVSNDINITETLLALDLQGSMAGYSGISTLEKITPSARVKLAGVRELARTYPSLEVLLGAKTDFYAAGWGYGMRVGGDVTPETLAPFDIKTYAIRESCIRLGPRKPIAIDDMYDDTIAVGKIFGVEERAQALIASFRQRLDSVAAKIGEHATPLRVFVYDSGEDAPITAGKFAMPTAIIAAAGGRNIADDVATSWTKVNWEAVVRRDPQFIIIVDYGAVTATQKIAFLTANAVLADIDAIRNRRFAVIPYAAATPGVRNIDAIEALARAFYPERF